MTRQVRKPWLLPLLFLCTLAISYGEEARAASDIYVSQSTGVNSSTTAGTEAEPFKSITYGLLVAKSRSLASTGSESSVSSFSSESGVFSSRVITSNEKRENRSSRSTSKGLSGFEIVSNSAGSTLAALLVVSCVLISLILTKEGLSVSVDVPR